MTGTELCSQECFQMQLLAAQLLHNYVTTQIIIFSLHADLEIYSTHLTA